MICLFFTPLTIIVKIFQTDFLLKEEENYKAEYLDSPKKQLSDDLLPPNVPNEDLPFRCYDDDESFLARPFNFLNSPLIKFINHLVSQLIYK